MQGIGQQHVSLLVDQTVDETTSLPINAAGFQMLTFYIEGAGTTSSGVVTLEEADWGATDMPFGGSWSSISTTNASDVTGGAQKAVHLTTGAYGYVRARISTAIGGGGSISVSLRMQ